MEIGNRYRVETDGGLNVVVYRKVKSKSGKETWCVEGYFATVKNALRHLVDAGVREAGLRDLRQVSQKQDELYRLIESLNLPGEPQTTTTRAIDAPTGALKGDAGCNTAQDKENHAPPVVTAQNRANVTAKIRKLASKGMSSRKIAETLAVEGIEISHMTVARTLQRELLVSA